MTRRDRICPGGTCFHVLNRAVARLPLFERGQKRGQAQFAGIRLTVSWDGTNVAQAVYTYHDGSTPFGAAGDLQTTQLWENGAWVATGTSYYRYYGG